MTTNYYSTSAYDSTKKRTLAPLNRSDMSLGERSVRKHPLSIPAYQCREYLASSTASTVVLEFKHQNSKQRQEVLDRNLHEYFRWATSNNKAASLESIVDIALYLWIVSIFSLTFIVFAIGFSLGVLLTACLMILLPFTVWLLGRYALKHGWVKHENNVMFNRRTGLITLPWNDEMISLPFDEFDAYGSASTTIAATTNLFLRLVHRYSDKNIVCPSPFSRGWELHAAWEEIQHFMDISKPLPDVAVYDFAREHDPVSAAYDKKYNRPKDYWKNSDLEELYKKQMASINAAEKYPWGETREQALKSGWQPSGFGEGDWHESQKDDAA